MKIQNDIIVDSIFHLSDLVRLLSCFSLLSYNHKFFLFLFIDDLLIKYIVFDFKK